jgi:hypothetical protein
MRATLFVGLFAVIFASSAQAVEDTSVQSTITLVDSYNQWGGGDVIFRIANPTSSCRDGYWLTKSDAGFNANLAMILSAYHAKTPVRITGLTDQIWTGSGGVYCKLYDISSE